MLQSLIQRLFPLYSKRKLLIAKVTLALQEPVCVNSYLPIPSGMIQLIQLFPQLGFASPNQQFNTVFLSSYCTVAALVHYWAHTVLSSM